MYVIERRPGGYEILHDVRAAELKRMRSCFPELRWEYTEINGVRAHRWVKSGRLHSTDLWVDSSGRIRRAGIGC